jgi:hypothetical protein
MSRITGSDAFGLMEAYNNVYTPQELTEEQVWEEVEAWVNSLVEEGYDLSEYTWEDMYEEYLNENQLFKDIQANAGRIGGAISGAAGAANRTLSGINRALVNRVTPKRPMPGLPASAAQPGGPASNRVGSVTSRFAGSRDAAFDKARQIQGSPVVGPRPTTQAPATPTRPAAQAPARPATPVSQKPAAPSTTTAPTAPASTPAAPARTFNPLMQRTFGYQTGNAPSQIAAASAGKPIPSGTALGSAANPEVRRRLNLPQKNLNQNFDPFDVVKGHLIDEGYADTEEAAAVIMVNMSEEWREGILEKFGLAADPSKPQSPKATKLARKRKRHDDWEGPGGEKMAQKARRVIGTQRRQDTETGVTK